MKKKIGEIYNKPIVTGDKNLVTRNEIHESTLKGGGTVDSGSSDVEYWKLNIYKISEDQIELTVFLPYMVSLARFDDNVIMPYQTGKNMGKSIDSNKPYVSFIPVCFGKWYYSLKDIFVEAEINPNNYLIPITKEEFYDLNNI